MESGPEGRMQVVTGCRHRGAGGWMRGRDGGWGTGMGDVFDGMAIGELGLNGIGEVLGTGVGAGLAGGMEVFGTFPGIDARVHS